MVKTYIDDDDDHDHEWDKTYDTSKILNKITLAFHDLKMELISETLINNKKCTQLIS